MDQDPEQLTVLSHLKDDQRISGEEYEELERDLLMSVDAVTDEPASKFRRPTVRDNLSPAYLAVLLVASAVLFLAGSMGLAPWLVSIIGIVALLATLVQGGTWVTIAGGVAVAVIGAAALLGVGAGPGTEVEPESRAPPTPTTIQPTYPGSLGIYLEDLPDLWNTVGENPKITRGLTLGTEPGEYDSFIYRFANWGRLAGAYDPSDDVVYALLATGQMSRKGTEQLYLHLCFVLQPYSQDCIDSYFETGLDGGTLEEFFDTGRQAEWRIGDQTWRLSIEDNVLTIRVLGEAVA